MHNLFILFHVISMAGSVLLISAALIIGITGRSSAANVASGGMVLSIVGTISGGILSLSSPTTLQCVLLAAYLVASASLYIYGFGLGSATKARLIRNSASIQKS